MAHFARLGIDNIVEEVTRVHNDELLVDGVEQESKGIEFLNTISNTPPFVNKIIWKQTSYNNNFRKQYAGVGDTYDETNNVFISPKPFASWTLDASFDWQPPTAKPDDGKYYKWNESTEAWDEISS